MADIRFFTKAQVEKMASSAVHADADINSYFQVENENMAPSAMHADADTRSDFQFELEKSGSNAEHVEIEADAGSAAQVEENCYNFNGDIDFGAFTVQPYSKNNNDHGVMNSTISYFMFMAYRAHTFITQLPAYVHLNAEDMKYLHEETGTFEFYDEQTAEDETFVMALYTGQLCHPQFPGMPTHYIVEMRLNIYYQGSDDFYEDYYCSYKTFIFNEREVRMKIEGNDDPENLGDLNFKQYHDVLMALNQTYVGEYVYEPTGIEPTSTELTWNTGFDFEEEAAAFFNGGSGDWQAQPSQEPVLLVLSSDSPATSSSSSSISDATEVVTPVSTSPTTSTGTEEIDDVGAAGFEFPEEDLRFGVQYDIGEIDALGLNMKSVILTTESDILRKLVEIKLVDDIPSAGH